MAIRPAGPWPALAPDRGGDEAGEDAAAAALRAELAGSALDAERQRLLFDLGQFHRREAKPAWWAIFDSIGKETDELIDDLDCLGGLEAIAPARREGSSLVRDYRFPKQETRLKPGQAPTAPLADPFVSVTLADLDRRARRATLKVGAGRGIDLPDRLSLHPPKPIRTDGLAAAVRAVIAEPMRGALGDWHGQLAIGPRTWYAGAPEADGFKHAATAGALAVAIGAGVEATPVATGSLAWRTLALDLLPADDPAARLGALLPPLAARRDTLARVVAGGRTGLAGEAALHGALAAVAHDFAHLQWPDRSSLAVEHAPDDLAAIGAPGTALHAAADALRVDADDAGLAAEDRAAARAALSRLYAFAGDAA